MASPAINMFAPQLSTKNSAKTASGVSSRLTQAIPYYTFTTKPSFDEVLDMALMCALCCTSTIDTPLTKWKSLLLTYTNILFDNLVQKMPSDQVRPVEITSENLASLRTIREKMILDEDTAMDTEVATPHSLELASSFFFGNILPKPAVPLPVGWLGFSRNEKVLCSHYSVLLYVAGKNIKDDNSNLTSVTVARPRALIEKYKIKAHDLLTGEARTSDYAFKTMAQAWLELTTFKSICFKEFATYTQQETNLQQDIIYTTVLLMRFMQMNHAAIIYKFLLAYPWVYTWSPLQKYVSMFDTSLKAANAVDPHLQPYIKIIYGDKSGLFQRKELIPLIACAVASEEETTDTLALYYHDYSFTSVVEAWKEERDRRARLLPGAEAPIDKSHPATGTTGTGTRNEERDQPDEPAP